MIQKNKNEVDKSKFPKDLIYSEFNIEDTFLLSREEGLSRWVMKRKELTGESYCMLASKSRDGTEQLKILYDKGENKYLSDADPQCRIIRKNRITFVWRNQ